MVNQVTRETCENMLASLVGQFEPKVLTILEHLLAQIPHGAQSTPSIAPNPEVASVSVSPAAIQPKAIAMTVNTPVGTVIGNLTPDGPVVPVVQSASGLMVATPAGNAVITPEQHAAIRSVVNTDTTAAVLPGQGAPTIPPAIQPIGMPSAVAPTSPDAVTPQIV